MVALATPTALPAPVIACLGPSAPGIFAEITVAPTVKELHIEPIGGQMVKVELTLTFVVRLAQDASPALNLVTSPTPTVPRPEPQGQTADVLAYINGSPVDPKNLGEIAAFRDYVQSVGHPPATRGALTQWVTFMKQRQKA